MKRRHRLWIASTLVRTATSLIVLAPVASASSEPSSSSSSSSNSSSWIEENLSSNVSSATVTGVLDDLSMSESITQGPALVATAMLLLGCFFGIVGSLYIKPIIFIDAFILGGYAFATLVDSALVGWSYSVVASWMGFLVGGIILAAVALSVARLSVCLVGAAAGVVLAYVLFIFIGRPLNTTDPIMVLVVLSLILGGLGGVAVWSSARLVLIAATSWTGAGIITYAIGYFAGGFPNASGLDAFWDDQRSGMSWAHAFPGTWWAYLAGMLVLFTGGLAAQIHIVRAIEVRRCELEGCSDDEHNPECGLDIVVTPVSSSYSSEKGGRSVYLANGSTLSSCTNGSMDFDTRIRHSQLNSYSRQPGILV